MDWYLGELGFYCWGREIGLWNGGRRGSTFGVRLELEVIVH